MSNHPSHNPNVLLSIGLMSGTSMDGIDAALLETDGAAQITDLAHTYLAYQPQFKILLKAAESAVCYCQGDLSRAKIYYPTALAAYLKKIYSLSEYEIATKVNDLVASIEADLQQPLTWFEQVVRYSTQEHIKAVKKLLSITNLNKDAIDVIGYHGQTLFHLPEKKLTIQIGEGQYLADQIGITVINDFRKHDVVMGGQGAPFAPIYHQALARRDKKFPMAVVNCGGISNITVIEDESEDSVIGFDIGPGNILIDRYVQQRSHGKEFMDEDGKYGKKGRVHPDVLLSLEKNTICKNGENYFQKQPPKSLDINDIKLTSELELMLNQLSMEDACATLATFTVHAIVNSLQFIKVKPRYWVLAGGGWKNPMILEKLTEFLTRKIGNHIEINTADKWGWNRQAMEAQIFAHFAVRSLKNLPLSVPRTTGVPKPITGGHAYIPHLTQPSAKVTALLQQNPTIIIGYGRDFT